MTCKPILVFLAENGVEPTRENKKRWQAGWTLAELKAGHEFVEENFLKNYEREIGVKKTEIDAKKKKENEKKILKIIEKEKIRRKKFSQKNEQFTKLEIGINYYGQTFIVNVLKNGK